MKFYKLNYNVYMNVLVTTDYKVLHNDSIMLNEEITKRTIMLKTGTILYTSGLNKYAVVLHKILDHDDFEKFGYSIIIIPADQFNSSHQALMPMDPFFISKFCLRKGTGKDESMFVLEDINMINNMEFGIKYGVYRKNNEGEFEQIGRPVTLPLHGIQNIHKIQVDDVNDNTLEVVMYSDFNKSYKKNTPIDVRGFQTMIKKISVYQGVPIITTYSAAELKVLANSTQVPDQGQDTPGFKKPKHYVVPTKIEPDKSLTVAYTEDKPVSNINTTSKFVLKRFLFKLGDQAINKLKELDSVKSSTINIFSNTESEKTIEAEIDTILNKIKNKGKTSENVVELMISLASLIHQEGWAVKDS